MLIQWFPGHMSKALREMEQSLKLVDCVIYVLDARAPLSSFNPEFEKRMTTKPFLYVLNKADLADERMTDFFLDAMKKSGKAVVAVNSTSSNATRSVRSELVKLLSERIERNRQKGLDKDLRAMVVGIPNCGKSTLINNLCGNKRAVTGDKPGVTKTQQWLRVDNGIALLDTPGALYPSFQDQFIARKLAYVGSIKDDILDVNTLALRMIEDFKKVAPNAIGSRYGVDEDQEALAVYEDVCKRRGFILRGGEVDYDRGAKTLLDEFRKGKLGKITLDTKDDVRSV